MSYGIPIILCNYVFLALSIHGPLAPLSAHPRLDPCQVQARVIIIGSPNVTTVEMDAFWDEDGAKMVLNAIKGFKKLEEVTFGRRGSRKWLNEEVEYFVDRMGGRIRDLNAYGVEDSSSSSFPSGSASLHLAPGLLSLNLQVYPPLTSICLPNSLRKLTLCCLCPIPPSISSSPLPPLLEHIHIMLAPFSAHGYTSMLPTPLDFSHLRHLSLLILDGGEETSNLISHQFFRSLKKKNAMANSTILLRYCVVDWLGFPELIQWFFGMDEEDGSMAKKLRMISNLEVVLFFGEWPEEQIEIARRTIIQYGGTTSSGVWEGGLEKSR
ncbi:hypothetical protein BT69DRAFT_1326855 [Atractiella rhizophila]|nr:hypothetical protein BT69DRAFT_1326855 [Atractiella rhizophila]